MALNNSLLIWKFLKNLENENFLKAAFQANKNYPFREDKSSFVYKLIDSAWLFLNHGDIVSPPNALFSMLRPEYDFNTVSHLVSK